MSGNKCFTIGLLICAVITIGCNGAQAYQKPLTPVKVERVQWSSTDDLSSGARYSAIIKPSAQVELSFRSGGYLRELYRVRGVNGQMRDVQEGDWVPKGVVLGRLREADYDNRVSQSEAQLSEARAGLQTASSQLAEAEAGLRQARADFDRAQILLESRSLTRPEFDASKARYETAQARVETARAQTEVIQARIRAAQVSVSDAKLTRQDSAIVAPMSCFLLRRNAEVGMLITPGTPAFTIVDASSVKAVFGVPDIKVKDLKVGQQISLTTEALPGVEFRGWMTRISASADAKSRVFEIELTIPNPPTQLRIGMVATLQLPGTKSEAEQKPVIPLTAVVKPKDDPNGYAVFVIEERDGKTTARKRRVTLGATYGNTITVIEGLNVSERIIVTGATIVQDGEQVRIIS
ncbi:MAG: efflux RND transporter periplasmic adaptor subunit [Blastocatellia bacterium]